MYVCVCVCVSMSVCVCVHAHARQCCTGRGDEAGEEVKVVSVRPAPGDWVHACMHITGP